MRIAGLQKTTLLDFPGKVACTVFLAGCNFRCPFCQNAEILDGSPDEVAEEEFFAFLERRRGILDGVCVSGGEPLVGDVAPFLRRIRALGYAVKLDTNGAFPEKLEALAAEGGASFVPSKSRKPFYIEPTSAPIRALIDTYNEVTGKDAKPFTMGGGTYARHFDCAVSFGMEEPGDPVPDFVGPMHGANEGVSKALVLRALKIYILAIAKLFDII